LVALRGSFLLNYNSVPEPGPCHLPLQVQSVRAKRWSRLLETRPQLRRRSSSSWRRLTCCCQLTQQQLAHRARAWSRSHARCWTVCTSTHLTLATSLCCGPWSPRTWCCTTPTWRSSGAAGARGCRGWWRGCRSAAGRAELRKSPFPPPPPFRLPLHRHHHPVLCRPWPWCRRLEVFKAERPGAPLRVYQLQYASSLEAQRYLAEVMRPHGAAVLQGRAAALLRKRRHAPLRSCGGRCELPTPLS
jgi:hypothetical protein